MWRRIAPRQRMNRSRPCTSAERAAGCALCNRLSAWDDAEVPEFGHESFGVERRETCHIDQSIARHRPEMRKPSALNVWNNERGETPNDIKVRKNSALKMLGPTSTSSA